jgi:hypothetical protein
MTDGATSWPGPVADSNLLPYAAKLRELIGDWQGPDEPDFVADADPHAGALLPGVSRFVGWLQQHSDRLVDGVMRATRESLGTAVDAAETLQASIELGRLFEAAFAEAHASDDGRFLKEQLRSADERWPDVLFAAQDLLAERVTEPDEFFRRRDALCEPLAKLRPYWAALDHEVASRRPRDRSRGDAPLVFTAETAAEQVVLLLKRTPEAKTWTKAQIAKAIGKSPTAVQKTAVWQTLVDQRKAAKLDHEARARRGVKGVTGG